MIAGIVFMSVSFLVIGNVWFLVFSRCSGIVRRLEILWLSLKVAYYRHQQFSRREEFFKSEDDNKPLVMGSLERLKKLQGWADVSQDDRESYSRENYEYAKQVFPRLFQLADLRMLFHAPHPSTAKRSGQPDAKRTAHSVSDHVWTVDEIVRLAN